MSPLRRPRRSETSPNPIEVIMPMTTYSEEKRPASAGSQPAPSIRMVGIHTATTAKIPHSPIKNAAATRTFRVKSHFVSGCFISPGAAAAATASGSGLGASLRKSAAMMNTTTRNAAPIADPVRHPTATKTIANAYRAKALPIPSEVNITPSAIPLLRSRSNQFTAMVYGPTKSRPTPTPLTARLSMSSA